MYNIVMPKSGGTHETRNAENVNQERLNENFSTLSKEIVKLWDSSENGFDSLAARLTSDEEVFITADDAEDIAVYEIENSAVIAALPTEILTAVSRVYETKSDASDKLDAAKNYTDSELVDYSTTSQTADMISQSVAHKVGDDEIISKINQSAEQIEIQANKVDLSGYVTFTNLSTPGQTTIDGGNLVTGTVTANKLDAADINASKTLTVGAMTDAAAATILNSNIQIGGRNLATGTATPQTVTTRANQNWFEPVVYPLSAYSATAISDANNTQITVSCDYSIVNVDTPFNLTASFKETGQGSYITNVKIKDNIPTGNSSGHAEGTIAITAGMRANAANGGVMFSGSGDANANAVLTVSNVKIEIGNKATTWTQAPEDVAADIATAQSTADSANSQEQLIYISKVSGTTTQSGTTTWVTDATGNQNTWTIKRPTYNSSYPVLFVATQRKAVDGTVTCTTPQIDNTTTVIDGGHITTGTIDASVVSVTNLNASNITSGTLSANYISGGIMTVGGLNNVNGYIRILDSTGNYSGGVGSSGITAQGEEPYSGLSHVISNAIFPYGYSLRDQTTQKQLINVDVQIPSATDEYAKYYIQGYDSGTQVSRVEFSSYPYNNGAYLILQGQNGLIRLNSDGTYAGNLTLSSGDFTVYGDATINNNATFNGVLDVVQRRCSAYLSSPGWYRAVKMPASYGTVSLHIERVYDANPPEVHNIDAVITYSGGVKCDFVNEESKSASQLIDKVRLSVASGFYYLDIHYTGTSANNVVLTFEASLTTLYGTTATQMGLATVADSPSGETTLTPYDFAANVPDASTGYTCLPDGTLIQWGLNGAYEGATTKETEVTFSKAFVDTNYSVNCVTSIAGTDYSNYDGIVYTVHRDSVSKCTVHQRVVGAGASGNLVRDFMWTAIGRWK